MKVFLFQKDIDLSFIEVHPGEWVVLKPNLIKESKETDPDEWECVITSPKIIELVCSDVCKKLGGDGKVSICDAPQTDSSFAAIAERLDLHGIARRCQERYGVEVEVLDLRNEEWVSEGGVVVERRTLPGDPNGTIAFDLGRESLFYGHGGEGRFYGADYDAGVVNQHHRGAVQEYLVCGTPIKADVFINLPKMKTHKKTGVTLNLKNLVGINADKNWLPHHTDGSPRDGGDQFPEMNARRNLERLAVRVARSLATGSPWLGPRLAKQLRRAGTGVFGDTSEVIRSGNWHGNDTTWRMVLDLNRCLLFGNPDGSLRRDRPKRSYCLIDGVVGMEGAGPIHGEPIASNVVIGGADPVAVDTVAARFMGLDWRKIAVIREAFALESLRITECRPEDIEVVSDVPEWNGPFSELENREFLHFEPHFGWKGHVEYEA